MNAREALEKAARLAAELDLTGNQEAFLRLFGMVGVKIITTSPSEQAEWLEALAKIAREM